jgi:hypothetical protein
LSTSFRLRSGSVVQARTAAELRQAVDLARMAKGISAAADDDSFRAFLVRRSADLGVPVDPALADLTELEVINPTRVDLVTSPANGAPFLIMKARAGQPRPARAPLGVAGAVVKSDAAQTYTLCVAYPADKPDVAQAADGHRDFASKAALEDAAWTYLTKSPKVGLWHEQGTDGAGDVVESYIYRGPDWTVSAADGSSQVIKSGDWLLGIRWSPETWPMVRDGQGRGVSMQGSAKRRAPSPEALAALGKAQALERQAALRSDPVEAEHLRQMAKSLREQLLTPAQRLAKAAEYEAKASRAIDPGDFRTYRDMAAAERRKAGIS